MTQPRAVNDGVPGLGLGDIFADTQRTQQMSASWDAYLGNLPDPLKVLPGETNTNVKSNRLAPIVDTGIYYLFGLPLKLEIDSASAKAQKVNVKLAQAALDKCWGDEDTRMTMLAKLAMNGGVFGQAFLKIVPPDESAGRQFPRVVVLNPQNITVQTDPDDCDTVDSYTIQYDAKLDDGSTVTKRQVTRRIDPDGQAANANSEDDSSAGDTDDYWEIATYQRFGVNGDWVQVGEAIRWPHPWGPIDDCQNLPISNQHWGQPDLTSDLIQLNKTLNFVLSNINAIGLSHGHPWIWAAGVDMSQVTTAPGGIIQIPNPDGKLEALIANGDIPGLMAYAADLRSDMDEQSKVPGVATGRISELPKGQMSGVTVRMLYMPLLFKTTFKQRLYGKLIRMISTRMLALCGFGDGTDSGGVEVNLHWEDAMPTDDLMEAQTAQAWSQLGVSSSTLMQRAGFDPEEEAEKKAAETQAQLTMFSRGQGLPPQPPASSSSADASNDATDTANETPATAPQASQHTTPPVDHPAAQIARAKVKAAFGKQ